MGSDNEDILVIIPDGDIPELYKMYENLDWAIQAISAIDNGIKWRKKTGDDSMVFMSPYNSWRQDGTFLLLMRIAKSYDIFIFTLANDCENLYKGLVNTTKIEYSDRPHVLFFSVDERHFDTVMRACKEKQAANVLVIDTEIFMISKETALEYSLSCPTDVYIDQLKTVDAEKVNEVWPHRYEGSIKNIEDLIRFNGGLGIYLKNTNELVAWVLLGPIGQIALLQVVDDHKRKGYAGILTMLMAQKIAKTGHVPFGTVLTNNEPSLKLFKKLGYKSLGVSHFVLSRAK